MEGFRQKWISASLAYEARQGGRSRLCGKTWPRRSAALQKPGTKTAALFRIAHRGVEDEDGAVLVDAAEGGAAPASTQGDEASILVGGTEVETAGGGDVEGAVRVFGEVAGGEDGEEPIVSLRREGQEMGDSSKEIEEFREREGERERGPLSPYRLS